MYNTGTDDGSLYYNDIKTLNVTNFSVHNASFYNPTLTSSIFLDLHDGIGDTYIQNLIITDTECYRCTQPFISVYHYDDFVMENGEITNISSTVYTNDPTLEYGAESPIILIYSIESDSDIGDLYRNITSVTFDEIYSYTGSVLVLDILGSTIHSISVNIDDITIQN